MRFHSARAIRLADAKPVHLGHTVKADGRWRVFAFADPLPPTDSASRLRATCEWLERESLSPLRRSAPAGADIDSVIEVIAICQQAHHELSIQGLPALLLPRKGRYGLLDYEKVYCPAADADQNIYDLRGIDRQQGCLVLVRPDQYVAHVLPLGAVSELGALFEQISSWSPVSADAQSLRNEDRFPIHS